MLSSFPTASLGAGEELKEPVPAVLKTIATSGLIYKLCAIPTTLEGNDSEFMTLILLRQGHMRIHPASRKFPHTCELPGTFRGLRRITSRCG